MDKTVKLWDIVAGKLLKSLEGSRSLGVKDLAFNPVKYCLAASGGDR
jgi:WD40 repeat protein